jgi:hypothetical protein
MSDQPPPSRLFPVIVLAVIVLLGLAGWLLFPVFQGFMARQDCVATGRTNC